MTWREYYLWRAVDQDGNVPDILVQRHPNKAVAKTFFRKLLKGCRYAPRVIVTDRLKSYALQGGSFSQVWNTANTGV